MLVHTLLCLVYLVRIGSTYTITKSIEKEKLWHGYLNDSSYFEDAHNANFEENSFSSDNSIEKLKPKIVYVDYTPSEKEPSVRFDYEKTDPKQFNAITDFNNDKALRGDLDFGFTSTAGTTAKKKRLRFFRQNRLKNASDIRWKKSNQNKKFKKLRSNKNTKKEVTSIFDVIKQNLNDVTLNGNKFLTVNYIENTYRPNPRYRSLNERMILPYISETNRGKIITVSELAKYDKDNFLSENAEDFDQYGVTPHSYINYDHNFPYGSNELKSYDGVRNKRSDVTHKVYIHRHNGMPVAYSPLKLHNKLVTKRSADNATESQVTTSRIMSAKDITTEAKTISICTKNYNKPVSFKEVNSENLRSAEFLKITPTSETEKNTGLEDQSTVDDDTPTASTKAEDSTKIQFETTSTEAQMADTSEKYSSENIIIITTSAIESLLKQIKYGRNIKSDANETIVKIDSKPFTTKASEISTEKNEKMPITIEDTNKLSLVTKKAITSFSTLKEEKKSQGMEAIKEINALENALTTAITNSIVKSTTEKTPLKHNVQVRSVKSSTMDTITKFKDKISNVFKKKKNTTPIPAAVKNLNHPNHLQKLIHHEPIHPPKGKSKSVHGESRVINQKSHLLNDLNFYDDYDSLNDNERFLVDETLNIESPDELVEVPSNISNIEDISKVDNENRQIEINYSEKFSSTISNIDENAKVDNKDRQNKIDDNDFFLSNNNNANVEKYTTENGIYDNEVVTYRWPYRVKESYDVITPLAEGVTMNDIVNGYKYYLEYQRENKEAEEHFSNQIKFQAHKHHNVDDIGKFILEKIPAVPRIGSRKKRQDVVKYLEQSRPTPEPLQLVEGNERKSFSDKIKLGFSKFPKLCKKVKAKEEPVRDKVIMKEPVTILKAEICEECGFLKKAKPEIPEKWGMFKKFMNKEKAELCQQCTCKKSKTKAKPKKCEKFGFTIEPKPKEKKTEHCGFMKACSTKRAQCGFMKECPTKIGQCGFIQQFKVQTSPEKCGFMKEYMTKEKEKQVKSEQFVAIKQSKPLLKANGESFIPDSMKYKPMPVDIAPFDFEQNVLENVKDTAERKLGYNYKNNLYASPIIETHFKPTEKNKRKLFNLFKKRNSTTKRIVSSPPVDNSRLLLSPYKDERSKKNNKNAEENDMLFILSPNGEKDDKSHDNNQENDFNYNLPKDSDDKQNLHAYLVANDVDMLSKKRFDVPARIENSVNDLFSASKDFYDDHESGKEYTYNIRFVVESSSSTERSPNNSSKFKSPSMKKDSKFSKLLQKLHSKKSVSKLDKMYIPNNAADVTDVSYEPQITIDTLESNEHKLSRKDDNAFVRSKHFLNWFKGHKKEDAHFNPTTGYYGTSQRWQPTSPESFLTYDTMSFDSNEPTRKGNLINKAIAKSTTFFHKFNSVFKGKNPQDSNLPIGYDFSHLGIGFFNEPVTKTLYSDIDEHSYDKAIKGRSKDTKDPGIIQEISDTKDVDDKVAKVSEIYSDNNFNTLEEEAIELGKIVASYNVRALVPDMELSTEMFRGKTEVKVLNAITTLHGQKSKLSPRKFSSVNVDTKTTSAICANMTKELNIHAKSANVDYLNKNSEISSILKAKNNIKTTEKNAPLWKDFLKDSGSTTKIVNLSIDAAKKGHVKSQGRVQLEKEMPKLGYSYLDNFSIQKVKEDSPIGGKENRLIELSTQRNFRGFRNGITNYKLVGVTLPLYVMHDNIGISSGAVGKAKKEYLNNVKRMNLDIFASVNYGKDDSMKISNSDQSWNDESFENVDDDNFNGKTKRFIRYFNGKEYTRSLELDDIKHFYTLKPTKKSWFKWKISKDAPNGMEDLKSTRKSRDGPITFTTMTPSNDEIPNNVSGEHQTTKSVDITDEPDALTTEYTSLNQLLTTKTTKPSVPPIHKSMTVKPQNPQRKHRFESNGMFDFERFLKDNNIEVDTVIKPVSADAIEKEIKHYLKSSNPQKICKTKECLAGNSIEANKLLNNSKYIKLTSVSEENIEISGIKGLPSEVAITDTVDSAITDTVDSAITKTVDSAITETVDSEITVHKTPLIESDVKLHSPPTLHKLEFKKFDFVKFLKDSNIEVDSVIEPVTANAIEKQIKDHLKNINGEKFCKTKESLAGNISEAKASSKNSSYMKLTSVAEKNNKYVMTDMKELHSEVSIPETVDLAITVNKAPLIEYEVKPQSQPTLHRPETKTFDFVKFLKDSNIEVDSVIKPVTADAIEKQIKNYMKSSQGQNICKTKESLSENPNVATEVFNNPTYIMTSVTKKNYEFVIPDLKELLSEVTIPETVNSAVSVYETTLIDSEVKPQSKPTSRRSETKIFDFVKFLKDSNIEVDSVIKPVSAEEVANQIKDYLKSSGKQNIKKKSKEYFAETSTDANKLYNKPIDIKSTSVNENNNEFVMPDIKELLSEVAVPESVDSAVTVNETPLIESKVKPQSRPAPHKPETKTFDFVKFLKESNIEVDTVIEPVTADAIEKQIKDYLKSNNKQKINKKSKESLADNTLDTTDTKFTSVTEKYNEFILPGMTETNFPKTTQFATTVNRTTYNKSELLRNTNETVYINFGNKLPYSNPLILAVAKQKAKKTKTKDKNKSPLKNKAAATKNNSPEVNSEQLKGKTGMANEKLSHQYITTECTKSTRKVASHTVFDTKGLYFGLSDSKQKKQPESIPLPTIKYENFRGNRTVCQPNMRNGTNNDLRGEKWVYEDLFNDGGDFYEETVCTDKTPKSTAKHGQCKQDFFLKKHEEKPVECLTVNKLLRGMFNEIPMCKECSTKCPHVATKTGPSLFKIDITPDPFTEKTKPTSEGLFWFGRYSKSVLHRKQTKGKKKANEPKLQKLKSSQTKDSDLEMSVTNSDAPSNNINLADFFSIVNESIGKTVNSDQSESHVQTLPWLNDDFFIKKIKGSNFKHNDVDYMFSDKYTGRSLPVTHNSLLYNVLQTTVYMHNVSERPSLFGAFDKLPLETRGDNQSIQKTATEHQHKATSLSNPIFRKIEYKYEVIYPKAINKYLAKLEAPTSTENYLQIEVLTLMDYLDNATEPTPVISSKVTPNLRLIVTLADIIEAIENLTRPNIIIHIDLPTYYDPIKSTESMGDVTSHRTKSKGMAKNFFDSVSSGFAFHKQSKDNLSAFDELDDLEKILESDKKTTKPFFDDFWSKFGFMNTHYGETKDATKKNIFESAVSDIWAKYGWKTTISVNENTTVIAKDFDPIESNKEELTEPTSKYTSAEEISLETDVLPITKAAKRELTSDWTINVTKVFSGPNIQKKLSGGKQGNTDKNQRIFKRSVPEIDTTEYVTPPAKTASIIYDLYTSENKGSLHRLVMRLSETFGFKNKKSLSSTAVDNSASNATSSPLMSTSPTSAVGSTATEASFLRKVSRCRGRQRMTSNKQWTENGFGYRSTAVKRDESGLSTTPKSDQSGISAAVKRSHLKDHTQSGKTAALQDQSVKRTQEKSGRLEKSIQSGKSTVRMNQYVKGTLKRNWPRRNTIIDKKKRKINRTGLMKFHAKPKSSSTSQHKPATTTKSTEAITTTTTHRTETTAVNTTTQAPSTTQASTAIDYNEDYELDDTVDTQYVSSTFDDIHFDKLGVVEKPILQTDLLKDINDYIDGGNAGTESNNDEDDAAIHLNIGIFRNKDDRVIANDNLNNVITENKAVEAGNVLSDNNDNKPLNLHNFDTFGKANWNEAGVTAFENFESYREPNMRYFDANEIYGEFNPKFDNGFGEMDLELHGWISDDFNSEYADGENMFGESKSVKNEESITEADLSSEQINQPIDDYNGEKLEVTRMYNQKKNKRFKRHKLRNARNSQEFTAKNVAGLEVVIDLVKNPTKIPYINHLNLRSPTDKTMDNASNSIQVHIALPVAKQNMDDIKRSINDGNNIKKVFSAKLSNPVDISYKLDSEIQTSSWDQTMTSSQKNDDKLNVNEQLNVALTEKLPPGTYLVVTKDTIVPKGQFMYKKVTCTKPTQVTPTLRLSQDFISVLMQELARFQNESSHPKRTSDVTSTTKLFLNKIDTSTHVNKIKKRSNVKFPKFIKKCLGINDHVCDCKCLPNRAMCKSCAASNDVISELMFEFENIGKYMSEHCTEIQTFFWMNPTEGKKLRSKVRFINKMMDEYFRRVKGKCKGTPCNNLTCMEKRCKRKIMSHDFEFVDLVDRLAVLAKKLQICNVCCVNGSDVIEQKQHFNKVLDQCMNRHLDKRSKNTTPTYSKLGIKYNTQLSSKVDAGSKTSDSDKTIKRNDDGYLIENVQVNFIQKTENDANITTNFTALDLSTTPALMEGNIDYNFDLMNTNRNKFMSMKDKINLKQISKFKKFLLKYHTCTCLTNSTQTTSSPKLITANQENKKFAFFPSKSSNCTKRKFKIKDDTTSFFPCHTKYESTDKVDFDLDILDDMLSKQIRHRVLPKRDIRNQYESYIESPLITDSSGNFWYEYLRRSSKSNRYARWAQTQKHHQHSFLGHLTKIKKTSQYPGEKLNATDSILMRLHKTLHGKLCKLAYKNVTSAIGDTSLHFTVPMDLSTVSNDFKILEAVETTPAIESLANYSSLKTEEMYDAEKKVLMKILENFDTKTTCAVLEDILAMRANDFTETYTPKSNAKVIYPIINNQMDNVTIAPNVTESNSYETKNYIKDDFSLTQNVSSRIDNMSHNENGDRNIKLKHKNSKKISTVTTLINAPVKNYVKMKEVRLTKKVKHESDDTKKSNLTRETKLLSLINKLHNYTIENSQNVKADLVQNKKIMTSTNEHLISPCVTCFMAVTVPQWKVSQKISDALLKEKLQSTKISQYLNQVKTVVVNEAPLNKTLDLFKSINETPYLIEVWKVTTKTLTKPTKLSPGKNYAITDILKTGKYSTKYKEMNQTDATKVRDLDKTTDVNAKVASVKYPDGANNLINQSTDTTKPYLETESIVYITEPAVITTLRQARNSKVTHSVRQFKDLYNALLFAEHKHKKEVNLVVEKSTRKETQILRSQNYDERFADDEEFEPKNEKGNKPAEIADKSNMAPLMNVVVQPMAASVTPDPLTYAVTPISGRTIHIYPEINIEIEESEQTQRPKCLRRNTEKKSPCCKPNHRPTHSVWLDNLHMYCVVCRNHDFANSATTTPLPLPPTTTEGDNFNLFSRISTDSLLFNELTTEKYEKLITVDFLKSILKELPPPITRSYPVKIKRMKHIMEAIEGKFKRCKDTEDASNNSKNPKRTKKKNKHNSIKTRSIRERDDGDKTTKRCPKKYYKYTKSHASSKILDGTATPHSKGVIVVNEPLNATTTAVKTADAILKPNIETCDPSVPGTHCVCDMDNTMDILYNKYNTLKPIDFQLYVTKLACQKYINMPKQFLIKVYRSETPANGDKVYFVEDDNDDFYRKSRSKIITISKKEPRRSEDLGDETETHIHRFPKEDVQHGRNHNFDWIRSKRSIYYKHYDTAFEDTIRMKRATKIDLSDIEKGLKNLPDFNLRKDEIYVLQGDIVSLDCESNKTGDLNGDYTWVTDRRLMLLRANVVTEGQTVTIRDVQVDNMGVYNCSRNGVLLRSHRVTVVARPRYDLVFLLFYNPGDGCGYDELKEIHNKLPVEMSNAVCARGRLCSARVDEPACLKYKETRRLRATGVLTITESADLRCGALCGCVLQAGLAVLCGASVPHIVDTDVVLASEKGNRSLVATGDHGGENWHVTHTLGKKESGNREYHQLASRMTTGELNLVLTCDRGYYLQPKHKICTACPVGYYSHAGATSCHRCPAGRTTDGPGASRCKPNTARKHHALLHRYDWMLYWCGSTAGVVTIGVLSGLVAVLTAVLITSRCRSKKSGEKHSSTGASTVMTLLDHRFVSPFHASSSRLSRPTARLPTGGRHLQRRGSERRGSWRRLSPSRVLLGRPPEVRHCGCQHSETLEEAFPLPDEPKKDRRPPLPPIDFDF